MAGNDSYTKLLLHCNGTNGSTSFPDDSYASPTHIVTATNGAQVSTALKKFGTGSCKLTESTPEDYLSVPDHDDWSLGTDPWFWDFWIRFTSTSGTQYFISSYSGTNTSFHFDMSSSNLRFRASINDVTKANYITTTPPSWSTGQWYHVAWGRDGSNIYAFQDGTSLTLTANTAIGSNSMPNVANPLIIGAASDYLNGIAGYMDEFRWSKGICRQTSSFTPSTSEYTTEAPPTNGGLIMFDL